MESNAKTDRNDFSYIRMTPFLNEIYSSPSMFSADSTAEIKCEKHFSFIVEWQMIDLLTDEQES